MLNFYFSREFIVYLFREALLCVVEDKRKGKQRHLEESPTLNNLRLKGRVYIKHIASLACSEADLSLTIHMVSRLSWSLAHSSYSIIGR